MGKQRLSVNRVRRVAVTVLEQDAFDVVLFDGEDAECGIAIDQSYFLDKLEHWVGIPFEKNSKGSPRDNIDERIEFWLNNANDKLSETKTGSA